MAESVSVAEAIAAGDRALARGAWSQARSWFDSVLESEEHPAALEGLSWAHWWQEDLDACLAAREHAYRGYRAAGDQRGAARVALWIGDDYLWYRGAPALAEGWFARARRLLEALTECPEHGWQAAFDAHVALVANDTAAAHRLAGEAQRVGRSQRVVGLEMFGLATDGVVCLRQGAIADGLRSLSEATAAALAGEYEDLAPAAWACCLALSACEELRDDERGAQWCQEVTTFSRRVGAQFVVGNCQSHYGSILTRRGQWFEAERELVTAARSLTPGPAAWYRDALARLGDLRRRQGRRKDAQQCFEQAGEQWLAQAGLAALRLDEDDADSAVELIGRILRQLPSGSPNRVDALEVGVRGQLARGEFDAAVAYANELREIADAVATSPLLATAQLCEARLSAAAHDPETATMHYADAVALFEGAGAPLEAAQARLELARSLATSSRSALAEAEARRAHAALAELGAQAAAGRAAGLAEELARGTTSKQPGPLTPRQLEVLRLAAQGLTERQIAERLVVSEHTAHRHLANIYTRLGCSSRAAAIARAGRIGLLSSDHPRG